MLDEKEIKNIESIIQKGDRILIIPHKSPDGDAIGSALALYQVFKNMDKNPTIACIDTPPEVFNFLPNIEKIQTDFSQLDFDTFFIVDCGATHLTGLQDDYPQLFDKSLEVINIDHHQSNDFYGKYNLVVKNAASTTVVLYEMFTALNIPIDRYTATYLLTGIYTDTGSFMHSNTTPEVMRISAKLLAKGADLHGLSKDVFNTTKISTMRLWGRILKSSYQTSEGVTMAVVTEKDFEDTGADYSEITGAVDYINSVPDSEYSVILTEREGKVKGSLRTLHDEVNVADIAGDFGGGGHTKAAGFTMPGKLKKEIRWKVVDTKK